MQKRGSTIASKSRGEREEELALFHEVRRGEREHERKSNAVYPLPPHNADLEGYQRASLATKMTLTRRSSKLVYEPPAADLDKKDDDLLTIELGKNDYDWLLTPPGTPLVKSSDDTSIGDNFLSRAAPFGSVQTAATVKMSRFSSTKTEHNLKKEGAILSTKSDVAVRSGLTGLIRSNGSTNSSLYISSNGNHNVSKKSAHTPGSRSSSRPTSPTKRLISSAHTSCPTTPTSRPKASSAPGSHPTTPKSRPAAALSPKNGSSSISSSSMITRKMGASSPAMTPIRRSSGLQTHSQSLPSAVSRSSPVSKARLLPRGSSPTTSPLEWCPATATPAFPSKLESPQTRLSMHLTTHTNAKTSLITPRSMTSRGPPMGSLSRQGSMMATTQVFSSLNQSRMVTGIPGNLYSHVGTSRTERQNSNSIMLSKGIQMGKSQDFFARNTKDADKVIHSKRSSFPVETSTLQTKHPLVKSIFPTSSRDQGGLNKQAPRRSLMQQLNLHEGMLNGMCSLGSSTPVSSLLSSRYAETQTCSNNLATFSNNNDYITVTSFEQDTGEVGEEFFYGSRFGVSPSSQSDHLASLFKDARINNWLGSQDYVDGSSDLMQGFEQGINKFESCKSPLVCPHGGGAIICDLCNVKMRLQMLNKKSKAANSQILGEA